MYTRRAVPAVLQLCPPALTRMPADTGVSTMSVPLGTVATWLAPSAVSTQILAGPPELRTVTDPVASRTWTRTTGSSLGASPSAVPVK